MTDEILNEDFVQSMLKWKEEYEKKKEEVRPMAEALGMTAEEYIFEQEQHSVNLQFIEDKGFDVHTRTGLEKALHWLETTDPDNLMYGDPTGDPMDIAMGEIRRGMLIGTVEKEMNRGMGS